ncbi:hypothetical protein [Aliikangiella sp. IMCC44359]|uniref:hypothetical protein n=1 Tax=Aliikangiella sp. IMCC44359 TaxID=3459125 RepID=UPI00403ACB09
MRHLACWQLKMIKLILMSQLLLMGSSGLVEAKSDFETITQLNLSMKQLMEVTEQLAELNGDEAIVKFHQIMLQNPDREALEAAGKSLKYPAQLKKAYDIHAAQVITLTEKLLKVSTTKTDNPVCLDKISALMPKFEQLKLSVYESRQYGVGEPIPRAKAYFATLQVMPLSIIVAQVVMVNMSVCRQG